MKSRFYIARPETMSFTKHSPSAMFYYHPTLQNGRAVAARWPVKLLFYHFAWPIKDGANLYVRIWDKFLLIIAVIIYLLSADAAFRYIYNTLLDIDIFLQGLAQHLVLFECNFRMFHIALQKESFKEFIREFYSKIYIEKETNLKIFKKIQQNQRPTVWYSYLYMATFISYLAIPIVGLFSGQLLLPFKLTLWYDFKPLPFYIPTLLVFLWIGLEVVSITIGEANLLATIILHLNGQYVILQEEITGISKHLLATEHPSTLAKEFSKQIIFSIRRNEELNEFAKKLESIFTFRIFIMMSNSAVLLCVLGFKAITVGATTENITYISWILAKSTELIVFGKLGSTIIYTTNLNSSMYYMSNWEEIVLHSQNTQDNVRLMKLITVAIAIYQKPFSLTGLKIFNVSLAAVVKVLKGAASYFTFLRTLR